MFRSPLLFLLLLVGASTAGVLFVKNSDGSFMEKRNKRDDTSMTDDDCNTDSLTLDFASGNANRVRKSACKDGGLDYEQENAHYNLINESGQLRYSTLPVVEEALMKDIFRLIAQNEKYMMFLNNPDLKNLYSMIRKMVHGPENQEVLQQQVWNKVLAIEAYYKKFFKPLNSKEAKTNALALLIHLREASEAHQLTVEDTVKLNDNLETFAFWFKEEVFNYLMTKLERTLKPAALEHKRFLHVRKNAIAGSGETNKANKNTHGVHGSLNNVEKEGFESDDSELQKFVSALGDSHPTSGHRQFANGPHKSEPSSATTQSIRRTTPSVVPGHTTTHLLTGRATGSTIFRMYRSTQSPATPTGSTITTPTPIPTASRTTIFPIADSIEQEVLHRMANNNSGVEVSEGRTSRFIEQEVLHRSADPGAGY